MAALYDMTLERGDSFQGMTLTLEQNAIAWDVTGSEFKMQFRKGAKKGQVLKTISDGNGITLVDPSIGRIDIDPFPMPDWDEGDVYYDLEKIDGDAKITLLKGVITLELDVTD